MKGTGVASDLPTGSHPLPRPSSCPNADTCKILWHSVLNVCLSPKCFQDDQQCDFPCTSTYECETTNGPEVGWQHIAPSSNAFPQFARTNSSPNIGEQIVQPVHSSYARFHAKVVTNLWNTTATLLKSFLKIARCPAAKQATGVITVSKYRSLVANDTCRSVKIHRFA